MRGLDCELSIPVSAEAHNLMVPNDIESYASCPHVRITVTKVQDDSMAKLYEGAPDDFDGRATAYEWKLMAGVTNGAFFAFVNSLNLDYCLETPMLQVDFEMDSDDGDDDDDAHHTRGGTLTLRPAINTGGDAINLSTDQFITLLEHCVDFRS